MCRRRASSRGARCRRRSPRSASRGKTSRSIETERPGGTRSSTSGSSTYRPALIRSVSISSGRGFSRNVSTRPSAAVRTSPYRLGSATGVSRIVAFAPVERWNATSSPRSASRSESPLSAKKLPSSSRPAKPIAPPVPSGSSSTAYSSDRPSWCGRRSAASIWSGRYPHEMTALLDAVPREMLERVGEERPVDDRQHVLARAIGERSQPRALATDQDHRGKRHATGGRCLRR